MASPAWLPQEAQPPMSGETPPTTNSAATTAAPGAPFAYGVHQNVNNASGNLQQPPAHTVMNSSSPRGFQPPVPGISPHAGHSFSYNIPQSVAPFSSNQHAQSGTNISESIAQDASKVSSASNILRPVPAPSSISSMPPPSDPNYRPTTSWMPTAPTFPVHPVMPGAPGNPGPPGLAKPVVIPANQAAPSMAAVLRQNIPAAHIASDPTASQKGLPYPPIPSMVAPPQGFWLQPPQMSGVLRPPFLQYPAAFPSPFPFPARGVALPAVPVPDSQPPGVTPIGAGGTSASSASTPQLRATTGLQTEVISAHADDKKLHANVTNNEDAANDQLDAWTAHKTEAGIVYYYNAMTGESTYDKPASFKPR